MYEGSDIVLALMLGAFLSSFATCVATGELDPKFDQARDKVRAVADQRSSREADTEDRSRVQRQLTELRGELERLTAVAP